MNKNSYLCNFIDQNPYDWAEKLRKYPYFIRTSIENGLCIFNYSLTDKTLLVPGTKDSEPVYGRVDFSLPIVQEARGIIIDIESKEVVCWPFRKFGNYGESYVDKIDWSTASVQEKIDGSIMKLYFNHKKNKWCVASNSTIDANHAGFEGNNYGLIFKNAAKDVLDYSILDKDCTYIFELISPETKLVVDYGNTTKIFHLGTRNNITGKEIIVDIGIDKPKTYPITSLDEAISAAKQLNKTYTTPSDSIKAEGFVVCDANFNRIKIKSPDYLLAFHDADLKHKGLSYDRIFSIVLANEIEEYVTYFPNTKEILYKYRDEIEALYDNIEKYINHSIELEKTYENKKDFFKLISKDRFSRFYFDYIHGYTNFHDTFNNLYTKSKKELIEANKNFYKNNPSMSVEITKDLDR